MAHYTYNDILERALPIGNGYTETVLELEEGDTADNPASTKWVFAGPGTVGYLIHPSGTQVHADESVGRRYIQKVA